jgi:hypothetical protein
LNRFAVAGAPFACDYGRQRGELIQSLGAVHRFKVAAMDEEAFKAEVAGRAVRDPAFRAALLSDPKGTVERELGQPLPDSLAVEVLQESESKLYLVLPLAVAEAEMVSLADKAIDHV